MTSIPKDNSSTNPLCRKSLTNTFLMIGLFYGFSALVFYQVFTTELSDRTELQSLRTVLLWFLSPILLKYAIQLIASLFYPVVEQLRDGRNLRPFTGKVSILVPAYNEEVGISKTLESITKTNYPDFEIIVINDGSTDNTSEQISQFIRETQCSDGPTISIKSLKLRNGGKARALNAGLRIATGDLIITIDADCLVDKHAVTEMVKSFNHPDVGAVAGNVVVGNRRKPIEVIQQLEYLSGFFFRRADSIFNSVYIIGGAAAAYRKSTLDNVGGFDHNIITEDIEMSTRILSHGYKTRYAANAVVYTEGPSDIKGLCNQRLRWKYGRFLTFIKHRNLFFKFNQQPGAYLTVLLLPLAVYAEVALLLEGFMLTVFYSYTILASDYYPLAFAIVFMGALITLQILFDREKRFHINLLALAPVAWIIFYVIDIIEFQALIRSIKRVFTKETLQWQKWVRVGINR
ncbi:MAG: glycosyltransferase family 2 protein [Kangiellaceae bacterium]|nr:glycosyltransferase family 2 protein [Kangiellaceae bacterium]